MSLEMQDRSGQPPGLAEIREAKQTVSRALVTAMMRCPPDLAVQLPNILRGLSELERRMLEEK